MEMKERQETIRELNLLVQRGGPDLDRVEKLADLLVHELGEFWNRAVIDYDEGKIAHVVSFLSGIQVRLIQFHEMWEMGKSRKATALQESK